MSMIRTTTPEHIFNFPDIDVQAEAKDLLLTYKQNDKIVFEKHLNELDVDGHEVRCAFTQEDTKGFVPNVPVKVQIKILTHGGDALASNIYTFSVKDVLNDEVMK